MLCLIESARATNKFLSATSGIIFIGRRAVRGRSKYRSKIPRLSGCARTTSVTSFWRERASRGEAATDVTL